MHRKPSGLIAGWCCSKPLHSLLSGSCAGSSSVCSNNHLAACDDEVTDADEEGLIDPAQQVSWGEALQLRLQMWQWHCHCVRWQVQSATLQSKGCTAVGASQGGPTRWLDPASLLLNTSSAAALRGTLAPSPSSTKVVVSCFSTSPKWVAPKLVTWGRAGGFCP